MNGRDSFPGARRSTQDCPCPPMLQIRDGVVEVDAMLSAKAWERVESAFGGSSGYWPSFTFSEPMSSAIYDCGTRWTGQG